MSNYFHLCLSSLERKVKREALKMLFPFLVLETILRKCRVSATRAVVKGNFPCKIFANFSSFFQIEIKQTITIQPEGIRTRL